LQNEHIIFKKIGHGGGANFTHVHPAHIIYTLMDACTVHPEA